MLSQQDLLHAFTQHLYQEERSAATCSKYLHDVRLFLSHANTISITKDHVLCWKQYLLQLNYAIRSINSMLASVNCFLRFLGLHDCTVKHLHLQRSVYCKENTELKKQEYLRLLQATGSNMQLNLILQTLCSTGIRISELQYFTLEAVKKAEVTVHCKNKIRTILIPQKLRKELLNYAKTAHKTSGPIFTSKSGRPLDRSVIWRQMKKLCKKADVSESKVFPHNLRKLFARTFYAFERDIVKLSDVLGHNSIDTTRIYVISTGAEHRRAIEQLDLVFSVPAT